MARIQPPVDYSPGTAVFRPSRGFDDHAVIAFIFENPDELSTAYDRAVRWQRIPDLRAMVRTAYLEKDRSGTSYINLGWKRVPKAATRSESAMMAKEIPGDRIAVRVGLHGNNRGTVISQVRSADSLWAIFHHMDTADRCTQIHRLEQFLDRGFLSCAPNTELVELKAISILGQLVRPKGGCLMQ